jgi:hypothetical protein
MDKPCAGGAGATGGGTVKGAPPAGISRSSLHPTATLAISQGQGPHVAAHEILASLYNILPQVCFKKTNAVPYRSCDDVTCNGGSEQPRYQLHACPIPGPCFRSPNSAATVWLRMLDRQASQRLHMAKLLQVLLLLPNGASHLLQCSRQPTEGALKALMRCCSKPWQSSSQARPAPPPPPPHPPPPTLPLCLLLQRMSLPHFLTAARAGLPTPWRAPRPSLVGCKSPLRLDSHLHPRNTFVRQAKQQIGGS